MNGTRIDGLFSQQILNPATVESSLNPFLVHIPIGWQRQWLIEGFLQVTTSFSFLFLCNMVLLISLLFSIKSRKYLEKREQRWNKCIIFKHFLNLPVIIIRIYVNLKVWKWSLFSKTIFLKFNYTLKLLLCRYISSVINKYIWHWTSAEKRGDIVKGARVLKTPGLVELERQCLPVTWGSLFNLFEPYILYKKIKDNKIYPKKIVMRFRTEM